jgi:hypothetical protein
VGIAAASFSGTTQRVAWLAPRAGMSHLARAGELLARIGPVSSISYGQLLGWLGRRLAPGTTIIALTSRDHGPVEPILRRLESSGHAVEVVWLGDASSAAMMTARVAHLTPSWQNADGLRIS